MTLVVAYGPETQTSNCCKKQFVKAQIFSSVFEIVIIGVFNEASLLLLHRLLLRRIRRECLVPFVDSLDDINHINLLDSQTKSDKVQLTLIQIFYLQWLIESLSFLLVFLHALLTSCLVNRHTFFISSLRYMHLTLRPFLTLAQEGQVLEVGTD